MIKLKINTFETKEKSPTNVYRYI